MNCNKCGKELIEGAAFCDNCGAPIETEAVSKEDNSIKPRGFNNKRKIIILAIAAMAALCGTVTAVAVVSSVSASSKLNEALELAQRYLSEYNYEQAVIEFQRVLQLDIGNVDAYLGLAEAYIAMGDKQSAIDILQSGYEITGDERLKQKLDELSASAQSYDLYRTNTLAVSEWNGEPSIIVALDDVQCVWKWCDGEICFRSAIYAGEYNYPRVVSVDVCGNAFVWLCEDGTVHGYGDCSYIDGDGDCYINGEGYVSDYNDIVDLAVGLNETFLLHADGTVSVTHSEGCDIEKWCQPVLSWSDIVEIKYCNNTLVGLKSDGTVVRASYYITVWDKGIDDWTDIADVTIANGPGLIGLKSNGMMVLSDSYYPKHSDTKEWRNIVSAVYENDIIAGLDSSGRVFISGDNNFMDVSSWTDICEIAMYQVDYDCVAIIGLKSDGTLVMDCSEEIVNESDLDYYNQLADFISRISNVNMPIRSYQDDM